MSGGAETAEQSAELVVIFAIDRVPKDKCLVNTSAWVYAFSGVTTNRLLVDVPGRCWRNKLP